MPILLLLLLLIYPSNLYAQQSSGDNIENKIVALVNGDVITSYDLEHNMRIIAFFNDIALSNDNSDQIRKNAFLKLSDDTLKLQKSAASGIRVRGSDVKREYRKIASDRKLNEKQLTQLLNRRGIDIDVFQQHLRAQIAWKKHVLTNVIRKINVDEQDVDAEMGIFIDQVANPMVRIAEIFLPVEHEGQEDHFINFAWALWEKIQSGTSFSDIAREVSRAPSALRGGEVGWVNINILQSPLDAVAEKLDIGRISDPIITNNGIYIILMIDRRLPDQTKVSLLKGDHGLSSQIVNNANITEWLNFIIIQANDTITDKQQQAELLNNAQNDIGDIGLCETQQKTLEQHRDITLSYFNQQQNTHLNAKLRNIAATLSIGDLSPLQQLNDNMVQVLLCDRVLNNPSTNLADSSDEQGTTESDTLRQERDKIREKLRNEALNNLATQALIDLRKAAYIDYR